MMTRNEKEVLKQIMELTVIIAEFKEKNESLERENKFLKELLLKGGKQC
jgi:hypothetical protein